MGTFYNSKRLRSYILIFLIILSFIIAVPVRKSLGMFIDSKVSELTDEIYKNLGLKISYKSLSPSLLTNFYVKDVQISDKDNVPVLEIDTVKVNYNIFKLLKKDLKEGITNVLISGIKLNLNELLELISKFSNKSSVSSESKITFEQIKQNIPKNIKLKNIKLFYKNDKIDLLYTINNVSLSNTTQGKVLGVDLKSSLTAFIPKLNENLSCGIGISGSITNDFNNSQMNIKISDISSNKITVNKLNFHGSYNRNVINIHTIQVTNPISVGITYNLETGEFQADLSIDNIKLISLFDSNTKSPYVNKIKDVLLTTNSKIKCNFNEKNINFYSENKVKLPNSLIKDGAELYLSFFGDEKHVEVTKLEVDSKKIVADGEFNLNFENFQLSGILQLPYLILPNGNSISTEFYFDPLDKGFMAYSPQLFIGSRAFTALQLQVIPEKDSIDFSFEMSDYSHVEESEPGILKFDGSYLIQSKYLQTSISLNTLYLDSMAGAYGEFLQKESYDKFTNLQNLISPFVLSGDIYVSTDFNSVSYNIPYVLLANTKKDNQVVMFALNGTDQNIQLNQFSLVAGKFALQANAFLDKSPDSNDLFFDGNVTIGAIPYHLTGTIMPEIWTIMGDYGSNIEINFGKNNKITGTINLESLPIKIMDSSFIVSSFTELKYNKTDGPVVKINRFEIEGADANVSINPRLSMSGNATKYGVQFDSLAYTDFYSALEGGADLMVDYNQGILEAVSLGINLKNPLSTESLNIIGTVSNPGNLGFSVDNLMKEFYINFQVDMNLLSLNRFASTQSDSNYATGSIYASGTIQHPYITANINNISLFLGPSFLQANGNILFEDNNISVIDTNIGFGKFNFNNIQANGSLNDFSVDVNCDFQMTFMKKILKSPLSLKVSNAIIPEGSSLPDTFTASLKGNLFEGSFIKQPFPLEISVFHSPEGTNILSSDNIGLSGFISSDGLFEINWDNKSFFNAKIDGVYGADIFNLQLYDFYMDMEKAFKYVNLDNIIKIENGDLTGEVYITGSFANPRIDGNMHIADPVCYLPFITPKKVFSDEIIVDIEENVIKIPPILIKEKKGRRINVGFNIYLNKFALDYMEGTAKTVDKDFFPGKLSLHYLTIESDVSVDLDLFYQSSIFEVNGKILGENTEIISGLQNFSTLKKFDKGKTETVEEETTKKLKFKTDLDIVLGTHSSMTFAPILRCIFVPNTKLNITLDQSAPDYAIDGEFKLRSGDIAYLNRSFYIKSGAIKFDVDDFTNPLITVLAETREHDNRGEPVKIILDVENQHLLDLRPKFRAEPPKSELEIQTILGQIAVADADNPADFFMAAGDYAIQSTFGRQFENKLRDLLNFDIFSIRTNVLQNTLSLGMSGNLTKENLSVGNFLDNSTVYIGKYLGSSLYLDAMLHISFQHNDFSDLASAGYVIFQPEFGMELESPFANIRFNMAPDINALIRNNQFVPSTSVTLSWNFTF